jgi:cellulose biosynthesis protein BcsQ
MIHFDDVLPTAREILSRDSAAGSFERVFVLRDLRGRIRLFVAPIQGAEKQVEEACGRLNAILSKTLGVFWGGLIEADVPNSPFQMILSHVRSEAHSIEPEDDYKNWSIVERHVAKSAWTRRKSTPPWSFTTEAPAIVAFFSHKGGVGRTTALCAIAVNLARAGRKVAVVDLDLEAPGLGLLVAGSPVECGVVDYLLERLLANGRAKPDIEEYVLIQRDPKLIGDAGEPIVCVPAGTIGVTYLEKLARLDYELIAGSEDQPAAPLAHLLRQIRATYEPAVILLDCRAGLHDLGGLAVQTLSHLNVIFGLDSEASWDGLRLITRCLGHTKPAPFCLTVQAMEPPPGAIREAARARFLDNSYNAFLDHYYSGPEWDPAPDIGQPDAPHAPFPIAYSAELAGYQSLADVAEILTSERYREFTKRIATIVGRPVLL